MILIQINASLYLEKNTPFTGIKKKAEKICPLNEKWDEKW